MPSFSKRLLTLAALALATVSVTSIAPHQAFAVDAGNFNIPTYTNPGTYSVVNNTLPSETQAPYNTDNATVTVGPLPSSSASGSYQINIPVSASLSYAWNRWGPNNSVPDGSPGQLPSSDVLDSGYVTALQNPNITVSYNVTVLDTASGTVIPPNGNVTVGQQITFKFYPYGTQDISWFGTGYSMDSPYGQWRAGAAAPPRVNSKVTCDDTNDYVTTVGYSYGSDIWNWKVYIPFSVNPPTRSITGTTGLSCQGSVTNGDGSVTQVCTVQSTGTLNPVFNYSSTNGYFYYRYYDSRDASSATLATVPGCYGNNIPLTAYPTTDGSVAPGYSVAIPADPISYPLTAVAAANNPPNAPTITGPTTGYTGTSYSYTFTATDPDNNTVRYGINDWSSSQSVTAWTPASGYVNSGTGSSQTHTWNTPGTYTIYAQTQDSNGASSAWSAPYTVTITNPPSAVATVSASPTTLVAGNTTTITYKCANSVSGTLIDNNTGTSIAAVIADGANHSVTATPSATDAYVLTCTDASNNTNQAVANVTVYPVLSAKCSVLPSSASTGTNVTWTAYPTGGTGTYTYSWSGTDGLAGTNSSVTTSYATAGTKSATVTVSSGSQNTGAVSCTANADGNAGTSDGPTVSVTALAPVASLTPATATINSGSSQTLTYTCTNSTSAAIDNGALASTATVSGSVSVTPSSATTYTLTCTGPGGTATASSVITVNQPDLTAGVTSPTSATQNVAVTLTSTAINNGASTASNFPNVFQIGVSGPYVAANTVASLASGGASSAISATYTFTSTGSYQVRACSNMNTSGVNVITESNYGNNCGAWQTITVGAAGQPNLTAGTPTPTAMVASTLTTVTATISNTGSVATGASFTDLLQKATDASGTGATDVTTYSNAALGASPSTNTASFSGVALTAGTWYLRVCADKQSSAGTGVITESNETDNCSAWTAVTVYPTLTVTCSVSPTSTTTNTNVTWTAVASGGTGTYTYSWSNNGGIASTPATGTTNPLTVQYSTTGTGAERVSVTSGTQTTAATNCSTTVTVSNPLPDLTAAAVAPTTATAGTVQNYAAKITNQGAGAIAPNNSFTNLLQKATDASGTGATDVVGSSYSNTSGMAVNGSASPSLTYNFPAGDAGTTKYLRVCADKRSGTDTTGNITESNENNNCGPWTAITVAAVPAPNLTAGAVTPTTATAGTAAIFSATVSNTGTASTGASFTNLLQKATDVSGTGATDVGTVSLAALAASASNPANISYTFPAGDAGTTKYLRVCADKSSSADTGVITESNETDNCGAWTAVTVAAPAAPTITSCTPSPASAAPNTNVTWTVVASNFAPAANSYTWSVTGGTPSSQTGSATTFVTKFASGGSYQPTVTATNGTQTVGPTSCTLITISGAANSCGSGDTPLISATPTRVTSGSSVVLTWSATGVTAGQKCTLTGKNVGGSGVNSTTSTVADSSCNVSGGTNTTTVANVTSQATYTITCEGVSQSVVVNVVPKYTEF